MFDRRSKSTQQNNFAAGMALLVLAGFFTAPTLAATSAKIDCPDAEKATLDVSDNALTAGFVSNNIASASATEDKIEFTPSDSLLAPRAAAAIRDAFDSPRSLPMAGTDSKPAAAESDDEIKTPDAGMDTELPGVSREDFLRYKKQMYRRDI
jgi:hypothetical protein